MRDLNIVLKDDEKSNGGVAFVGETLLDFMNDLKPNERESIDDVNAALIECGIKPINAINYPEIKEMKYFDIVTRDLRRLDEQ
ncbi:hypothetical protein FOC52_14180 (plasmid) [Staphylococcus cohnii]|nr:hypothetical protein [Staphylococcus arlettae]QKU19842.1 hypothetical protein FOC52_13660 [Staphylococcus cohnii]MDN0189151.1 hypothetical protein [Staphylococcus arlettae]MDN0189253.1 hypothetical protein [Staphylococcus arlettae]MDN0189264.1 hypothetical protein [Staphylococcus arlettae]